MRFNSIGKFISTNTKQLHIYCDGACKGNPGPAGSGLSLYKNDQKKPLLLNGGFLGKGTNNTAELFALSVALQIAHVYKIPDTVIFSDSKYSIDCVTKWAYNWAKKGWEDRANIETIKKAHFAYNQVKDNLEIKHVKGHAGIEGNELADRMANVAVFEKNKAFEIYNYDSILKVLAIC